MKLSFDWLSDFVDLTGESPQSIADKLTMKAFEVEEVLCVGADIQGPLIVGKILEINPHPNADKIRLTKICLEEGCEPKEIVCGANNISVGQHIPVALPGAKVINRHDGSALQIKESKIRGITSNGMLCSGSELGLDDGTDGILILPDNSKIGSDAKSLLGLTNDYILIVEPRSNRGDALSVMGLAREVAAILKRPLKTQSWLQEFKEFEEFISNNKSTKDIEFKVNIESTTDCPYFSTRILYDIKVEDSSSLIKRRLENIGIRPVNNIVDITNYVLIELGQPLHAYDLDKINGNQLNVRRAKENEILRTLDSKDRNLNPEILVISDQKSPVGIAGIMGGKDSEISNDSQNIALEAASFASSRVRRSGRSIGLSSDSSLRFERGVDTGSVQFASDRASHLLIKHCSAKLGSLISGGTDKIESPKVSVRMSELKRICQIDMTPDTAAELLEPLGFKSKLSPDDYHAGVLSLFVPSYRQKDISREIDLVEEICRLWGYDKIPVSMPSNTIAASTIDPIPEIIRHSLSASGLSEVWTSSLVNTDDLFIKADKVVGVLNPLSPEHQVLRQSLICGLLKTVSYNQDRGRTNPCLFEIGKIYNKISPRLENQKIAKENINARRTNSEEEWIVSGIICGDTEVSNWLEKKEQHLDLDSYTFFQLKGIVERLVQKFSKKRIDFRENNSQPDIQAVPSWLHPGRKAYLEVDNIGLGWFGEIHPGITNHYKIKSRVAAFEFKIASIKKLKHEACMRDIYSTPSVIRDLTADVPAKTMHKEVEECILSLNLAELQNIQLISIFKLSDTQQSLSYRLSFQHPNQTLTAELIDKLILKIRETLNTQLKANFRA